LLETMDYAYRAHHMWVRPVIPELPSAYFKRNCFATFQEDHVGLAAAEQTGVVDNLMWANDYPHHDSIWPHSREIWADIMADVPESEKRAILIGNVAKLYKLAVPAEVVA